MRTAHGLILAFMVGVAGCTHTLNGNEVVAGVGDDDLLKLRSGPGLNHSILLGLPDGTGLRQGRCVSTQDGLWCRVSLTSHPKITGYVSSAYLVAR